jgi:hypothetical protein
MHVSLLIILALGALVGGLGGWTTGLIVRRAMSTRPGISLFWTAAGWAVACVIGLVIILTAQPLFFENNNQMIMQNTIAFGASVIGGIGGGVTFWQINKAQRASAVKQR